MSETIFEAVDRVKPQGLEAMLGEVVRVASDEHDYNTVWQARFHLKRLELGLPDTLIPEMFYGGKGSALKELSEAVRQFRAKLVNITGRMAIIRRRPLISNGLGETLMRWLCTPKKGLMAP